MHNHEAAENQKLTPETNVAVVGARGYSGVELCRILLAHPGVKLAGCFATDTKFSLSQYLMESKARAVPTWSMVDFDSHMKGLHTLFLATPAEVSLELAPRALALGVNVIDLSGAFRLQAGTDAENQGQYRRWYALDHTHPALLKKATYGLAPWRSPAPSAQAQLVSNPGCYATAVLMAVLPLLKVGAVDARSLVIDAKSGTSGAGRKASESILFTEVEGECLPYKVAKHQHWPEIVESCELLASAKISPFFTTHLLNVRRGIIASIYARLDSSLIGANDTETEKKLSGVFQEFYGAYPLVRFGALGSPETDALLSLKRVVGTARTHISFRVEGDKLFLFSTIDNLVKGAAGQAVENFNKLTGQPVETGLADREGVL